MKTELSKVTRGTTVAQPEEVGYRSDRLDVLDRHLGALIDNGQLQCAGYLLARDERVFAYRSQGRLDYEDSEKVLLPDSIRGIASITKWFTAVALLKLVEEGKLQLHQPVAGFLPEFDTPLHKSITPFHLLTHTSGLKADGGYFTEPYPRGWWEDARQEESWITSLLSGPMLCKPGESWNYSSGGYAVLGEIIAKCSDRSYEEYVMESIVRPLRMERTFFDVPESLREEVCVINDWNRQRLHNTEDRTGKPPRAGGGLYSTLYDLWRFGQMCMNGGELDGIRIVSHKTVELLTRNQLSGVPAFSWGENLSDKPYGLGIGFENGLGGTLFSTGTYSHEGAGRSGLYVDPDERLIAVFFVPSNKEWVPESILSTLNIMWSGLL